MTSLAAAAIRRHRWSCGVHHLGIVIVLVATSRLAAQPFPPAFLTFSDAAPCYGTSGTVAAGATECHAFYFHDVRFGHTVRPGLPPEGPAGLLLSFRSRSAPLLYGWDESRDIYVIDTEIPGCGFADPIPCGDKTLNDHVYLRLGRFPLTRPSPAASPTPTATPTPSPMPSPSPSPTPRTEPSLIAGSSFAGPTAPPTLIERALFDCRLSWESADAPLRVAGMLAAALFLLAACLALWSGTAVIDSRGFQALARTLGPTGSFLLHVFAAVFLIPATFLLSPFFFLLLVLGLPTATIVIGTQLLLGYSARLYNKASALRYVLSLIPPPIGSPLHVIEAWIRKNAKAAEMNAVYIQLLLAELLKEVTKNHG